MELYEKIVNSETRRLNDVVNEIKRALKEDSEDYSKLNNEINELKKQKLESLDWNEKNQIEQRIKDCRGRIELRTYQDPKILRKPYFGVLELEDDDLGDLAYCFGIQSVIGKDGRVLVIDWREAPVSRLYYEYESGDEYDEDIRGRERSGSLTAKRKVDTTDSKLKSVVDGDIHLVRMPNGNWENVNKGTSSILKEEKKDHRLPEITALISTNQFSAITQTFSKIFLLQGGAGSGKTTVGLHRISYLVYNHPDKFKPDNILVIVFNKSLQKYISGVLPSLNIKGNVITETYHRWAGSILQRNGISPSYNKDIIPEEVIKFKKSAIVLKLVDSYIGILVEKSRDWFLSKLEETRDSDYKSIKENLMKVSEFKDLIEKLESIKSDTLNHHRERFRLNIIKRLNDHSEDLYRILTDTEEIESLIVKDGKFSKKTANETASWQKKIRSKGLIDFSDVGILLYILQKKGFRNLPFYSHIMIDEAQDLSEVEIATIIHAADNKKSVTVCGDMAQKIKGDVNFDHPDGFEGFIKELNRGSKIEISAEKFEIGYRASKPIMDLAWHVLGEKPKMAVPRDGSPVELVKYADENDLNIKISDIVKEYESKNPGSLLCIITRFRNEADQIYSNLKSAGLDKIRRHDRDNFSFQPGAIVTNAHQIKGLEFSAVIIVNPSEKSYRDNLENRMLLHVSITRASEQLWIMGKEPLAYGIEKYLGSYNELS